MNDALASWNISELEQSSRYATPKAMGDLLERFYTNDLGLTDEQQSYVLKILRTPTKDDRFRIGASLPEEIRSSLAHKIGTILEGDGLNTASDIGIVTLPDGRVYIVVIYNKFDDENDFNEVSAVDADIAQAAISNYWAPEREEQITRNNVSTVFIDEAHANVGRLTNLIEVGKRLEGIVIPAGQTIDISPYIFSDMTGFMNGYAYIDESGTSLGGGMCGAAASLAKAAFLAGIEFKSEARHYFTDHSGGGLYENLPNASFSRSKYYNVTNTTGSDLVIHIEANYTADDIEGKGEWDTFLDPQKNDRARVFSIHRFISSSWGIFGSRVPTQYEYRCRRGTKQ